MALMHKSMKQFIAIIFFVCAFVSAVDGQTARQYIKAADEEMAAGDYYSAMKHYQFAMDIGGEKTDILYKYAEAARLFSSYTFADTAYTKILLSKDSLKYPLARYWLALVKKKIGDYENALFHINKFIDTYAVQEDSTFLQKAQEEKEHLEWALSEYNKRNPNIYLRRLNDTINTAYSEFAPVVENGYLYFSSQQFEREVFKGKPPRHISQVLRKKLDGDSVELLTINNPVKHTGNLVFNANRTRVYFTVCSYVGESVNLRCELYCSNIDANGKFGQPTKLPDGINMKGYTATHPAVGVDPATGLDKLFFVSDRPGGKGGLDIWFATIFKDGTFDAPFNFEVANTSGDEVTPFFHLPSNTLFFSSNGWPSFGGFDFYKTSYIDENWSSPSHIPAPLNSSYDDLYYWTNELQTEGYFSSNRLGSNILEPEFEACCNDLYFFNVQLVNLKALTFDHHREPLNGVTVSLMAMSPGAPMVIGQQTNEENNEFNFKIKKGDTYLLTATKPGFLSLTDTIDLSAEFDPDLRDIERKLYLVPDLIDLNIQTFNARTKNPLKDVGVRIAIDGQEVHYERNPTGNNVAFKLERGKLYEVIGTKVAYFSDTIYIDLRNNFSDSELNENLFLKPKEIEDFPPLIIYFDNDYPDPKSWSTETTAVYEDLWKEYMSKKEIFIREAVKARSGQDSFVVANRTRVFFEREVAGGWEALKVFTESVQRILADGEFKIELELQGYASPRASEDYNFNLSQRRASCLRNHFRTWNNGALRPYIENGMLTLEVVAFGEKLAPQFISDRLDDERESIYSVSASFQRKVAIIGVRKIAEN